MALFIYDNGTLIKNTTRVDAADRSLLTNPTKNLQSNPQKTPQQQNTLMTKHRPARSNSSRLYEETGKKSDSLQDRRRLSAQHVMSSPAVTVGQYETVKDAWFKMQNEQIDHLIVVNNQGHPTGVITGGELLRSGLDSNIFVDQLISRSLIAVNSETLVREIALVFMEQKVSCVPVVAEDHSVIGIVCRSDLLSLLVSGPNLEQRV